MSGVGENKNKNPSLTGSRLEQGNSEADYAPRSSRAVLDEMVTSSRLNALSYQDQRQSIRSEIDDRLRHLEASSGPTSQGNANTSSLSVGGAFAGDNSVNSSLSADDLQQRIKQLQNKLTTSLT
eukprot:GFYU01042040.1.p1 GENE.GFYU01042040.1~~GFYU01042040.1.p1  ORF type:complete len:124 (+),score=11.54 GFYU01042040.1:50-421(+)